MAPQFILDLQDLDAAGKALKATIPVAWLRGALEGCEAAPAGDEGQVELRYSRSGTDLILHGNAHARVEIPCARCTKPVALTLDPELSLLLVPATSERADFARGRKGGKGSKGASKKTQTSPKGVASTKEAAGQAAKGKAKEATAAEEYETSSADADLDVYDGNEVALDPFLREALLLEIPPFPLCEEGCRGIAPPPSEEGQKPEIDPRLAPLLKFKKPGN